MNKFLVFPCVENDEDNGYQGQVVSMAHTSNVAFMLFFPIAEEYAKLVNFLLKKEEAIDMNLQLLSVYQTMLNSWSASDRYLSGIIIDYKYDPDSEVNAMASSLMISDDLGNVDAVLHVGFVHAIILAAMERKEVIVTNELLHALMPTEEEEEEVLGVDIPTQAHNPFPVDKDILDIARDIMSDKTREDDDHSSSNDTKK